MIVTRKWANGTGLAGSYPSFGIYERLYTILNYYATLAGYYALLSEDGQFSFEFVFILDYRK